MILEWIAGQFRMPRGFAGKIVSKLMARGNMPANLKTVEALQIANGDSILEIGFGPGLALDYILSHYEDCSVKGIDFSELMFREAEIRNKRFIREKRLELLLGDFRESDFRNETFSKVFGVNVIYFWSDVEAVAKKLHAVLKCKGKAVFFMANKRDLEKMKFPKTAVFNKYEIDEVQGAFRRAGFEKVWHTEMISNSRCAYIIQAEKE